MPWFKVDDNLAFHHKTLAAGNPAMGVWVRAGAWSAGARTDGFVPTKVARALGTRRQIARLERAGLWIAVPDGYLFASHLGAPGWACIVGDYRPNISPALRELVYARDGYTCLHCGTTENLSLDHIWPYSLGGADTLENLQTLCRLCNSKKGARV